MMRNFIAGVLGAIVLTFAHVAYPKDVGALPPPFRLAQAAEAPPNELAMIIFRPLGPVISLPPTVAPQNIVVPSISGNPFATTSSVTGNVGTWTGNPTYTCQWLSQGAGAAGDSGTPIPGATNCASYSPVSTDIGNYILLQVTGTNSLGSALAQLSSPVGPVPPITTSAPSNLTVPSIAGGSIFLGGGLTATAGTWDQGASDAPVAFTYAWFRGSTQVITGQTPNKYAFVPADAGQTLTVQVTAINSAGQTTAVSAGRTAPIAASPPVVTTPPSITGNAIVGATLTCSGVAFSPVSNNDITVFNRVVSGVSSPILNTTSSSATGTATYVVGEADVGNTVTCSITGTNFEGSATGTSAASATIAEETLAPANTTAPSISGTLTVGQKLTANQGVWSNNPLLFTFVWNANGTPIPGATASTFTLAQAQAGQTITVAVLASNDSGNASATSAATAAISVPSPTNTAAPVITGNAVVGGTLQASNGSWEVNLGSSTPATTSPPTTFTHSWNGAGSPTNQATYKVVSGDLSHTLVDTVTATNPNGSTAQASAATAAVTNPIGSLSTGCTATISGSDYVSATLTASASCTAGSPTFTYQWFSAGIAISTGTTHVLAASDLGNAITVEAFAANSTGTVTATSAATPAIANPPAPTIASNPTTTGGTGAVGQPITVNNGSFSGPAGVPITVTAQILDTPGSGPAVALPLITNFNFYVPVAGDVGNTLTPQSVATVAGGASTTASGTPLGPVANPPAPTLSTAPAIFGDQFVGGILVATTGAWTSNQTGFGYQWLRNGTAIANTTSNRQYYTLIAADQGANISVRVTASNAGGSNSTTTATVGPIAAFPTASGGACAGFASTVFNDGCAKAPAASAYTIQHANFFSGYAQQQGQSYVSTNGCKGLTNCHPPWAVAGVDYPVGVSTVGTGFASPGSATDPTNSSSPNYGGGNPAGCQQSGNLINCGTATSAMVNIGPFDFSFAGNSSGIGMGLTLTSAISGPCLIHDSYFVFDTGTTGTGVTTSAAYDFAGCSIVILKNDVFRVRNPSTGQIDGLWNYVGNSNVFIEGGANGQTAAGVNRPIFIEYSALVHCTVRCVAAGGMMLQHNYLDGINMIASSAGALHGDGLIQAGYNGPTGETTASICNCNGLDSLVEQFDTWNSPAIGTASTTCYTCSVINAGAGTLVGWFDGGTTFHATGYNSLDTGWYANAGDTAYGVGPSGPGAAQLQPGTVGVITQCQNASGVVGCNINQINSCSPTSPCLYTLNINFPGCPNANSGTNPITSTCSLVFDPTFNVNTVDYQNNVWVSNAVNSTGAAGEGKSYPYGMAGYPWAAGDAIYQNVIVNNNYVDGCAFGGALGLDQGSTPAWTTGFPARNCLPPVYPATSIGGSNFVFTQGLAQLSYQGGGNVLMTDGACLPIATANTGMLGTSLTPTECNTAPAPLP